MPRRPRQSAPDAIGGPGRPVDPPDSLNARSGDCGPVHGGYGTRAWAVLPGGTRRGVKNSNPRRGKRSLPLARRGQSAATSEGAPSAATDAKARTVNGSTGADPRNSWRLYGLLGNAKGAIPAWVRLAWVRRGSNG